MEITVKSILGPLGEPNHNGRIYSKETIEKAVEQWKKNGWRYGTLNPDYEDEDFLNVPFERASHTIKEIHVENNELWGTINLLSTPRGKIAEKILDENLNLTLAPRMVGEVTPVLDEEGNPMKDEAGNEIKEVTNMQILSLDLL